MVESMTEIIIQDNEPDVNDEGYTALEPIEIKASTPHNVETVGNTRDKAFNDFVGLDLSEDEVDQLGHSEIAIDVDNDGSCKIIKIRDKDAGRNLRHRMVASLYARGFEKGDIAKATGYTAGSITSILKIGWVRDAIIMFQDKVIDKVEQGKNLALTRMARLSLEAVDTYERGLYSVDENIQHKSARAILEGIGTYDKKVDAQDDADIGTTIGNLIRKGAIASASAVQVKFKDEDDSK